MRVQTIAKYSKYTSQKWLYFSLFRGVLSLVKSEVHLIIALNNPVKTECLVMLVAHCQIYPRVNYFEDIIEM